MRNAGIIWNLVIKVLLLILFVSSYYREDLLGVMFFGLLLIAQILTEISDKEAP